MMDKSRSKDDIFLYDHFCKRCGIHQSDHDDKFCSNSKYPALEEEQSYLFKIAELYNFDLTKANEKQADGGRHGAIEGDILLDAIALVHQYTVKQTHLMSNNEMLSKTMIDFVKGELSNWGHEIQEINKVNKKIQEASKN